ncbi:MAG: hypothetical protein ACO4CG_12730 [Prochlorothrix sp.]
MAVQRRAFTLPIFQSATKLLNGSGLDRLSRGRSSLLTSLSAQLPQWRSLAWISLGMGMAVELWLWDWQLTLAGAVGLGGLLGADRLRHWLQRPIPPWQSWRQHISAPQQFLIVAVGTSSLAALNTYWLTVVWSETSSPGLTAGLTMQSLVLWLGLGNFLRSQQHPQPAHPPADRSTIPLTEQLYHPQTVLRLSAVQTLGQGLDRGWEPEEHPWAIATLQTVAREDPDPGVRHLAAWHLQVRGLAPASPDALVVPPSPPPSPQPEPHGSGLDQSDPNPPNSSPAEQDLDELAPPTPHPEEDHPLEPVFILNHDNQQPNPDPPATRQTWGDHP